MVQRDKARNGLGRDPTTHDHSLVIRLESSDDGEQVVADALIHFGLPRPPLSLRCLQDAISLHQLFLERRQIRWSCHTPAAHEGLPDAAGPVHASRSVWA